MEITWNQTREDLESFLAKNDYKKVQSERWTRGSFFDFHPEYIPHDLVLKETTDKDLITLEVIQRYRLVLGSFDKRSLGIFYQNFDQGKLTAARCFDATSFSGIFAHGFYELSGFFLGLFGVLLFLWSRFSEALPEIVNEATTRIRTYELIAQGMGFPSFPDSFWLQKGFTDSIQPAAMILAFILTFAIGLGPLIGLVMSSVFPGRGFLVPWLAVAWSLLLCCGNVIAGGPWSDLINWLVAPWCVFPGYWLVVSLRKPFARLLSARKIFFTLQVILVLIMCFCVGVLSNIAFPKDRDDFLPEFWTPEGLLTVRDEVLWEKPFGRWLSDTYYNHVFLSNFYLRSPLATKWADITILYMGDDQKVINYFIDNNIILFPIHNDSKGWKIIRNGLPDVKTGQFLGPQGFELLLVDQDQMTSDFWLSLDQINPWFTTRAGIVKGNKIVSPAFKDELEKFEGSKKTFPQAIEEFLYVIQRTNDKTVFRQEMFSTGRLLLMAVGLPLLVYWAFSGLAAVSLGLFCSPWRRKFALMTNLVIFIFIFKTTFVENNEGSQKQWKDARAHVTFMYSKIEAIFETRPRWNSSLAQRLQEFRNELDHYWDESFFEQIRLGSQSKDELTRTRVLATLDRLCRSLVTLHKIYKFYGQQYLPPKIESWEIFQKENIVPSIEDTSPRVSYWAIKLAGLSYHHFEDIWSLVEKQLGNVHLNIRDKAVLAIDESHRLESIKALHQHYIESTGSESCDYVRLHEFWALLKHRKFLIEEK